MRFGFASRLLIASAILFVAASCSRDERGGSNVSDGKQVLRTTRAEPNRQSAASQEVTLRDVSRELGLHCVQVSGAAGQHAYPEIVFGGVCVADLNGDQRPDVVVPQGGAWRDSGSSNSGVNALFVQAEDGRFVERPLAGGDHYTMGAFAADVDQDGDLDLLMTNAGVVQLLLNQGDATFEEATEAAGIPRRQGVWLNAVIMDVDQDRAADIYVANYVDWTLETDITCRAASGQLEYCNPANYSGQSDLFLRGKGDGTFEDATASSGIGAAATRSMGVVLFDADQDGQLDIFVANDGEANLLWMNQGDGTYLDEAMMRGVALNAAGKPEASMGVAVADVDDDGDEDLIVSHLKLETHTVYRNDGGYFVDATALSGVGTWSRPDTGFGIGLLDINNDRHLDLFVANGAVVRPARPFNAADPYAQPDRVMLGNGKGQFARAARVADDAITGGTVSRGAAFGDLDGDGLCEALVSVKDGPLRVLRLSGESPAQRNWIGIRPMMAPDAAAQIGASAQVIDIQSDLRTLRPHASYLGSSEHLIRFGLGDYQGEVDVVVKWLDGKVERFDALAINRVQSVLYGKGSSDELEPPSRANASRTPVEPRLTEASLDTAPLDVSPMAMTIVRPEEAIPPIDFEGTDWYRQTVLLDVAALRRWCDAAGLPEPPSLRAVNGPTWRLLHERMAAVVDDPTPENVMRLGMVYDGHQLREAAIALYRFALSQDPQQAKWWHLLGRALSRDGKDAAAIAALERALELDSDSAATAARLGQLHLERGDAEGSVRCWQQYLAGREGDPLGKTGLAYAREAQGQLEEALRLAKQAIRANGNAKSAMVLAARLCGRLGDRVNAGRFEALAERVAPNEALVLSDPIDQEMYAVAHAVGYLKKASLYFRAEGDFERAYGLARELAERQPEDARNWQLLLWLAMKLAKEAETVDHARMAVETAPEFAPGWEVLARASLEDGEPRQALHLVEKALAIDPDFVFARSTKGRILVKLSDFRQAVPLLTDALEKNPTDLDALKAVVSALRALERSDEALQLVERHRSQFPNEVWLQDVIEELKEQ